MGCVPMYRDKKYLCNRDYDPRLQTEPGCQKRTLIMMNPERFIARRLIKGGPGSFSGPVIRIAIISVALGLAVMIVSVAIVTGFQHQVREKIVGFGSHIQVAKFDANNSFEFDPVSRNQPFLKELEKEPGIRHIQVFATKAGIIKTADQIQGVVLKGAGTDFDWSFFSDKIEEGRRFGCSDSTVSDSVLISRSLATLLKIRTGDPLRMYFIIGNDARARRFTVSGIYNTGLNEFDRKFIFCDLRQIQKLNGWGADSVSGFDIYIRNFDELDRMGKIVYQAAGYDLNSRTIRELYPQLFDWLDLQDMNVVIILVLMVLVSGMAMITTLLILILERTRMIGVLKALGARNLSVRRIFMYNAAYITGKGLLFGNLAGLGICLIQKYTGIIRLPQESYFMPVVPIRLDLLNILLLNAGTLAGCVLMLWIPSFVISRISPVKAIRFD
jgi:lipoprotein-releasing system permease protein